MNAAQTSLDFDAATQRSEADRRREFAALVVPLRNNLYGAAMRLTRNPTEAEDLVQDTMVRAFRFWESFNQGTNIKAWMFTILRNTFINGYHRRGRKRSFEKDVSAQLRSICPAVAIGHSMSEPAPSDEVIGEGDTRDRIAAALAALPPDYRLAVTLADLEDLSYKEIAEVMDCPLGTVMSRIYRGRKILYSLLYDHAREMGYVEGEQAEARPSTRGVR